MTKVKPDHHAMSFGEFMNDFVMESDRAAVILGASKVEALLGAILDKFFLPTVAMSDDLLEGDSPLATFSSRIKICHRLGLIDDQFAKLLNVFRRLRNGFAHEVTSNTLSAGSARDRVAAMAEAFVTHEYFASFLSELAKDMKRPESDSGVIFRVTLAIFCMQLGYILSDLTPVSKQPLSEIVDLPQPEQSGRKRKTQKTITVATANNSLQRP